MENVKAISAYYRRYLGRLIQEAAPWARDNIAFAGLMLVAPCVVAYVARGDRSIDWDVLKSAAWLYLCALAIYLAYQMIRTAWKLDCDRSAELAQLNADLATAKNQLEAITSKDLPKSARALSSEILDFYYAQSKDAPPTPTSLLSAPVSALLDMHENQRKQTAFEAYEKQTLGIYGYKYSARVTSMVALFQQYGIESSWIEENSHLNPRNVEALKTIATGLSELAAMWEGPYGKMRDLYAWKDDRV